MRDPTAELIRVIRDKFDKFSVEEARSRGWASGVFSGVRHRLSFRTEGPGAVAEADTFLTGLEEREFALRGHILADIALVSDSRAQGPEGPVVRISLEALTVEDA